MFAKIIGKRTTALATSLAVVVGLAITPAFAATAAEGDEPAVVETPVVESPVVEPVETPPAVTEPVEVPAETPPAETPPPPAEPTPVVEPVETPTPATESAPATEPTPVTELVEVPADETPAAKKPVKEPAPEQKPTPATEPAPVVELVETPAAKEPAQKPAPEQTPAEETTPPAPQLMQRGASTMGTQSFGVQSAGITPASIPDQLLGQPVDIQFGGVDADNWRMSLDVLSNTDLSSTGHLTGQFTRPGQHVLWITATKQVWHPPVWFFPGYWTTETVATKSYPFKVVPAVLTATLPGTTVGDSYSQQLDGTLIGGVVSSNTFSLVSGALPPGLSLSSSGAISGTVGDVPTNPTTYTFEVKLRVWNLISGTHDSAPKTLSITVGYPAPTWNAITLPEATVGVAYPATSVSANGNGWAVGTYTASGLPDGLELSTAGVITGTPLPNAAYSAIQTVPVTFTADNGKTTATTVNLVVKSPPTFATTSPLPNAVVGTPYSTTIDTAGPDVTYTLVRGPAGMVIDSATGELTGWTPTDENNVRVRVKASNAAGDAVQGFTIKPFAVPTITTMTLVNGIVGQAYSDQIVFDGRNAKLTKSSGKLPNGVALKRGKASNGAGVLSGTPSKEGVFTFTVEVTNSAGTAAHTYEIRVHDVPVIHVTKLARGVVGQAYTDSVQFSGLDAVATLHNGTPPTGMTLNSDGTFSGAPTETGVFRFTVKVTNPAGSVKHRYRIVSFDVPAFTTTTLDQGIVGIGYSQQLTADGHNVRFVVPRTSSLPTWLTLDKDGLLHGTPTAAGDYTFDVRARNFAGKTVQSFTLSITQPVMTLSTNNIIRGNSVTINGSGYLPGDSIELWLNSTPVLLGDATATGGTFTSTVMIPANTAPGQYHLVVKAAQSGTQSMPLTVSTPPAPPQSNTPQPQGPQLTGTPGDDEPETTATDDSAIEETEVVDDTAGGADGEELPTLNEPEAEEEAAADEPANLNWLLYAGFALLLAALLLWFILWRRRRALDS